MNRSPKWSLASAILIAALALGGCEVEKKEEGRLPDVEVEGGKLPRYDVEGPDVDVGTEERTITVPDIDIDPPGDDEPEPVERR